MMTRDEFYALPTSPTAVPDEGLPWPTPDLTVVRTYADHSTSPLLRELASYYLSLDNPTPEDNRQYQAVFWTVIQEGLNA